MNKLEEAAVAVRCATDSRGLKIILLKFPTKIDTNMGIPVIDWDMVGSAALRQLHIMSEDGIALGAPSPNLNLAKNMRLLVDLYAAWAEVVMNEVPQP